MWTSQQPKFDQVSNSLEEITHDFGNQVTVVTSFKTNSSKLMHGDILVSENELIQDTQKYTTFLNNIDNEVNPIK
jgi:hypothetical protein